MAASSAYDAGGWLMSMVATGSAAVALMGLSPAGLIWAAFGATAGMIATKSMPRLQAIAAFVVSAPAAALIAKGLARYFTADDGTIANILAFSVAALLPFAVSIMQDVVMARGRDVVAASLDRVLLIFNVKIEQPPSKDTAP